MAKKVTGYIKTVLFEKIGSSTPDHGRKSESAALTTNGGMDNETW